MPHYWLDGQEVDFYWENGQMINACFDASNPDTRRREMNGLLKGMEKPGLNEGLLLTRDESGQWQNGEQFIHIRPLWTFLLEMN
ncbi:MAG: hypothetical protein KGS48_08255 [Bacteroidetes bacterium]|nr:hypothetical protein [Bacteroidota bacterium]